MSKNKLQVMGIGAAVLGLVLTGFEAQGRAPQKTQSTNREDQAGKQKSKPLTEGLPQRELSEKERKRREKKRLKEIEGTYKKWLTEEVGYIIIKEEKEVFRHLSTDEEREQFIEQFWLRRDPTPDTVGNEFKEEHYRRIAYANDHFSSSRSGWRTDRGRIYITWGPPDDRETYPTGGNYLRSFEEGGGSTSVYPFERWRYRYLEGVGQEVILEFVSVDYSSEYRLALDPTMKDELAHFLNSGLSLMEAMGFASKAERFDRGNRSPLRVNQVGRGQIAIDRAEFETFDRLTQYAAVLKPPQIKFKDLEALVTTRISFNLLPFDVRTDFLRITDTSILVPITISVEKEDVTFRLRDGLHQSVVNVFGRVTTLTGRIVQTFEDVLRLNVPPALFVQMLQQPTIYQKALPLRPGLYKLNLVLKDLNSGNLGTVEQRLIVPRFEEEQLAHSSLILADRMERIASKNVGSGQFVIGDTKVRPAVGGKFSNGDRIGVFMQVYNLGINEQTHKPEATIKYAIRKGEETVFSHTESSADLEHAGRQITLEKMLNLAGMNPGEYTFDIQITDHVRQQTLSPSAHFRIVP